MLRPTQLEVVSTRTKAHETSDHNPVFWKIEMDSGRTFWRAHWNVQGTDSFVQVSKLLREVIGESKVITLNEVTTARLQGYLYQLRADGRIGAYLPGVVPGKAHPAGAVPIIWDPKVFDRVGSHHHCSLICDGAAGRSPNRYANRILLEFLDTHEGHWAGCTHWVHAIDIRGRARKVTLPGQIGRGKDCSAGTAKALTGDTSEEVAGQSYAEFLAGDLNVDFNADKARNAKHTQTNWFPYHALGAVADVDSPNAHGPTHGKRLIDWGVLRQPH